MQAFKKLIFAGAAFFAASLSAQPSIGGIGSVTAPSMPTVTSPTIGGGFYVPGFQNGKANSRRQEMKGAEEKNGAGLAEKENEAAKKIASTLTAGELSALGSMGLLGNFTGPALSGNIYSGNSGIETKEMLEKVLSEIEGIKRNAGQIPAEKPVTAVASAPVVSSRKLSMAAQKASSRILRFSVNDYDILKTCGKIYISDVQQDGSFLVTGDRRYLSDGKQRKETFHMLFKSSGAKKGDGNYTAAASVTQDYLNEYSFLFQLSKMPELSAMRTGNLVAMRTDDASWKMELLIDLGEKKESK